MKKLLYGLSAVFVLGLFQITHVPVRAEGSIRPLPDRIGNSDSRLSPSSLRSLLPEDLFPPHPFRTGFIQGGNPSYIVSDDTWIYSPDEQSGWQQTDFDDSGWSNVVAPSNGLCDLSVITPDDIMDENGAQPMWSPDPMANSTVYFRKTFFLDSPAVGSFRSGFDDDGNVYINGHLVLSNMDGTDAGISTGEVSQFLRPGENVVAIQGIDSAGGCQRVLFELKLTQ